MPKKSAPIPYPPRKPAAGWDSIQSVAFKIWEETHTGRGIKSLFQLNQPNGFDCPSCAWPDPDPSDVSRVGEYCENGAKAVAWEASKNTIGEEFFREHSIADLMNKSDHWLEKQGRISQPFIVKPGSNHYEPLTWEAAFSSISGSLRQLEYPDQALFYTSGRTSNEAAFLYQCMVRQFGTNNLPDCSNMCHEASGKALMETLGIGKASVTIDDIPKAEVMLIFGQNPGTNAPRMLTALQKLKANGGKIMAVNPLPEAGLMQFRNPQKPWEWVGKPTAIQDLFLPITINADWALLKALQKLLLSFEEENPGTVIDKPFIDHNTGGYQEFIADLKELSLEKLIAATGLAQDAVHEAAEMLKGKRRVIIAWAMGITQHSNAESTIREFVNLLLMLGAIGKEGAGTLPVRGHSNVQGDRTMGIWEKMPDAFLDRLGKAFNFSPPRTHGVAAVDAVRLMLSGKGRFFFGLGGNFALAAPDTQKVFEALRLCNMTVQVSTKLNRSHLVHGKTGIILPCLGRTERDHTPNGNQFVSTEDTAGRVRMSKGDLPPVSKHLKSEVEIICRLGRELLGKDNHTNWEGMAENYDLIRDKIQEVIPGFEDYNIRVRSAGGFYLPNGPREGKFHTPSKKAIFTVNPWPLREKRSDTFILMTIRSHDQFNTSVYGMDDRYRGIRNSREVVLIHPEDMQKLELEEGDSMRITSHFKGESRTLEGFKAVPYDMPLGTLAVYFPEGNVLVALDNQSGESLCPSSKYIEASAEKLVLS
ncbi:FdhF/YdeP family oxidoreductase [Pleomorphovibrio marinus]|uniref:FdhF/YdeP family oxidoreductase n=1 Tax=Pleomorphovibrio marinus TaxID=2164132 RepID=UPI000E09EBA8|nr:FdhF/YdeP family oxidoreductase [Pleomorphovibrio marinus]